MTVYELYAQVAQLGFESSLEKDEDGDKRFYFAVNRALLQIASVRPAAGVCVINHIALPNCADIQSYDAIRCDGELIYSADYPKAYSFEASGNGTAKIEKQAKDGSWETLFSIPLSGVVFKRYRGLIQEDGSFVSAPVRLRFSGDYLFSVRGVALYTQLAGGEVEDIPPFEPFTRYDMTALCEDFLAFRNPPIQDDEQGKMLNQDYRIEGRSVLLLPRDAPGAYKVIYRQIPQQLEIQTHVEDDFTEIQLDAELCSALPLLVASYVWADDEPEKAQYYLSLYRERIADIEMRQKNIAPVPFRSVNGW